MKPALTLLAALLLAPLAALPAADDTLFMNEDAWHYFTAAPDVKRGHGDEDIPAMRPEFTLTKQGLEHYIDEIARGHVTHFVMNLNSQRANFPSKTLEPLWKSLDEPERDHLDYIRAMKALYESGVDPYQVWIDHCRVKGIQPWISIRMNDLHRWDEPKSPNISTFWHTHPEYRLRPGAWDNGLDYMLEPVRKRMLDFITEVLERYDPEGIELDLMRFRRYLPIGREKECAPIFTTYLREIRKVVNSAAAKRGHTITLSVRLSSKPSESRNLGMEADVWAKESIVDLIVPTSPWESIDFDIPLDEWRTWTGDKVPIVPSADDGITEKGKRRLATLEEYNRWAASMRERGAKSLYLFNLFMHPQDGAVWNGVLSGGLAPLAADAAEPVTIDFAKRTWQGIPGLERTAKGRVFVSWFTGGAKEPEPLNTVVLSHSDDGGKTFSAPQAMGLPLDDGTRCYDPCLWIDPKGRLWYLFNRSVKDSTWHGVYARICEDPDATVPVWGAEFRVGFDSPFSFRMNKPLVLSSGEWVLPVVHALEPLAGWAGFDPKQLFGAAISTDEGKTWKLHGAVKTEKAGLENMIVELKDGRLWMLIRTEKVLWESHSSDKGLTWTEGKPTTIATPHSRFFIRRLASGNLLLVNHYKFTGRSHLTAQLSTDDGKTWNDGLLLDERGGPNFPNGVPGGVSYPDGVQDKDGLIWITYDRNRNGLGEILLAKFKEEDVAAGKNVSGAVSLKQVVNKLDKPSLLPANWDPALAGDIVMQRLVKVTAPQVKGAHDAEFVCVGERAYVVSEVNDLKGGEDGGWPFIYSTMSIVNLKTLKTERVVDFAKGEQAFANETLPSGACWVPRIIQKDPNTLRCYFVSQNPGKRQSQMWYRDFDLGRNEFAPTIHKAKLKTAAGTFDFQPQYFHADAAAHGFSKKASDSFFFIFDSFKKFDGKLYVALNNFTGQQNALALVHDDLETFEVLGHYNEPQSAALSESAVNRLPDGTWMAICRNDKGNYHFTTSQDGRTWTIGEPKPFVPNGLNSKPTFEQFGGVYYLGWQEATSIQGANRSVFNVDVSRDGKTWERKYRFETPHSFQYPTFHEHEGAIWLCVTQGDTDPSRKERIMFGKLEAVGQFESQQDQKRIEWPPPPPATLQAAESNQPAVSPSDALIAAPLNTVPGPEYQSAARPYQGIPEDHHVNPIGNNPIDLATFLWQAGRPAAAGRYPIALKAMGEPCRCAELEGAERAASIERGGNGRVAHFAGKAWYQADFDAAQVLRPSKNAVTLYARARLDDTEGEGTLFFTDSIGLGVQKNGLAVGFLGEQIPSGVTLRELPLAVIERGRWLDLVLRVGDGSLQFFCDGVLQISLPVVGALRPPCRAPLNIGAFYCRGMNNNFFRGSIERVALWDQALTDAQVAALSGVKHLAEPGGRGASSTAILAYNRFFDASVRKDIGDCGRQERAMRELMAADPNRPIYHLTAPLGWMYDPAGAYYHQGLYHVFTYRNIYALLQYCSLDHFVSDDLVHWRQWPVGPWADGPLDICGIWLNNHFVDDRGELNVIYSAHGEAGPQAYVEQGIRARSLDGMVSFVDKRLAVAKHHDGHTWKEDDTWYALTVRQYRGSRPGDAGDALILLSSTDLDHWTELGEIYTQSKNDRVEHPLARQGFMEFPYLLPFGDRDVLILGGLPVRYWVGRLDRKSFRFIPDEPQGRLFDYANPFHCFNPLIVDRKGPGGAPRRVVLAMMPMASGAVDGLPWNGVHAMPRALSLDGDHLRQDPLPEFESLRGAHVAQRNIRVAPGSSGHVQKRGDALEIRATFDPGDARLFGLKVRLSDDGQFFVRVFYDARTGEYGVDGNCAKPRFAHPTALVPGLGRGPAYLSAGSPVTIRVFLDKCLVETFVNGQTCTTIVENQDSRHDGLDLFSEGGTAWCTSLDIWEMNRAEPASQAPEKQAPDRVKTFQALDTNKDGVLTIEEYKAALNGRENIDKGFQRLDKNGDGKVSREEFFIPSAK